MITPFFGCFQGDEAVYDPNFRRTLNLPRVAGTALIATLGLTALVTLVWDPFDFL